MCIWGTGATFQVEGMVRNGSKAKAGWAKAFNVQEESMVGPELL